MSQAVSITEVSRHFSDYVNRVAYEGAHFILVRGKKPLAELRPLPKGRCLGELPGLLKALPHLSREEADAFHADLEQARANLRKRTLRSRWDS
jgi:antitoxin (DNA-binding transcriptional repressor) of toxin-antitoxin stability system